TYGKTLSRHTVDEKVSGGGAVQGYVADDDVFVRDKLAVLRWVDCDLSSRQTFGDVVVGFTFQFKRNTFGVECSERLTRRPFELKVDGVVWQTFGTVAFRNFV